MNLKRIDGRLSLVHTQKKMKPLSIDFIETWKRTKIGKKDEFAKAIGISLGIKKVADLTAGLGSDSIKLLKLGCTVVAVERSPIMFALLEDALLRAKESIEWMKQTDSRFQLQFGDSLVDLNNLASKDTEVLYLDPMFPSDKKKGLSSREMQYLQELIGEGEKDADQLFSEALNFGPRRLVMKRPQHASHWQAPPADLIFSGRSVRYEVWIKQKNINENISHE